MNKDRPSLPAQISELITLKRDECSAVFHAKQKAAQAHFNEHGRTLSDPVPPEDDKE